MTVTGNHVKTNLVTASLLLIGVLIISGCGIPRDIDSTTENALTRGSVQVGLIAGSEAANALAQDPPSDNLEIDRVEEFASGLDLVVDWKVDSENNLMEELKTGEIDLVVGGITSDSPWKNEIALTRPFAGSGDNAPVAALRNGENRWLREWETKSRQ